MNRWFIVALIVVGVLISYLDRANLSLAVLPITHEFGYSAATMGVLLSSFFWTYTVFQIPSGALVDRYGIRRTYAVAFLLWSLASAGVGLSRGFGQLVSMRLVLGMAESVVPVASLAYIRRNFESKSQGLPTAIYLAGLSAGPAVGTLLGVYLLSSFGWRGLFLLTGLGALAWLVPWLVCAPNDPFVKEQTKLFPPASTWLPALGSVAMLTMAVCVFMISYYWYFIFTWAPAYLEIVQGFSTIRMGHFLAIPLFAMAVTHLGAGAVSDRLVQWTGRPYAVRVGFIAGGMLGAGTLALLAVVPSRAWVLPVLLVSMCSIGAASPNYWALAQALSPASAVGRTIGYLNMIAQLAGVAAPLVTGWLLGRTGHFRLGLAIAGACPVLGALVVMAVGSNRLRVFRQNLESNLESEPGRTSGT